MYKLEEVFNIDELDELEFNGGKESTRILLVDHNVKQRSVIVNKLNKHFRIEVSDNMVGSFLKALGRL